MAIFKGIIESLLDVELIEIDQFFEVLFFPELLVQTFQQMHMMLVSEMDFIFRYGLNFFHVELNRKRNTSRLIQANLA